MKRRMPPAPAASTLSLPFPDAGAVEAPSFGLRFVSDTDSPPLGVPGESTLFVRVPTLSADARGRLAAVVDEAIETALRERSAAAPGWVSAGKADPLSDQLFRARGVGATEIVLVVGELGGIADAASALDVRDSETLRSLADASRDRPLTLVLHESVRALKAYRDTVPLEDMLGPAAPVATSREEAPETPSRAEKAAEEPRPRPVGRADTKHRAWATQLRGARGPQPLAVLEKLFCQAYMPLTAAIESGLEDAESLTAHNEFRQSFAKSYGEAAATFNSASKRPRMVLDAFDCAVRTARLHGARTAQLLLVDSMRWDIGAAVQQGLRARLAPRATLTDEMLLWSALPTRTPRQLDSLAHGIGSLREPWPNDAPEEVVRGRTADVVRRLRAGARELHKLDVVETMISEAGAGAAAALPAVAEKLLELIVKFCDTLSPRTLVFVFGDHGFVIGPEGAKQGGASPEEVLVPAFGVLLGEPQ